MYSERVFEDCQKFIDIDLKLGDFKPNETCYNCATRRARHRLTLDVDSNAFDHNNLHLDSRIEQIRFQNKRDTGQDSQYYKES